MPMRCPTNDGADVCGPTCVGVAPSPSLSLSLSLRSGRVPTPFLLGMLSSPRLPLRVPGHGYPRRSAVSWHGHGSHGDLLASWHPSSYENRREEGRERKREKERERDWWSRATRRRSRGPSRDTAARITRATSLIFLLPGSPEMGYGGVVMSWLVRGSVGWSAKGTKEWIDEVIDSGLIAVEA